MKKKFIIGMAGIAAIVVTAVVTVSSVNARSTESDLLTKNLEALTQGEGGDIMDLRMYYVYAYSSTHWNCTPGGSSACPRP